MRTHPLRRLAHLVPLMLAGCIFDGAASRRALLAACTFNDECEPGLVCAARQCRAECRTDRDCTNGWLCASAGQPGKKVCYEPENLTTACEYVRDCRSNYICGPAAQCRQQCTDDYDCTIRAAGTTCIASPTGARVCSDHPAVRDAGGADVAADVAAADVATDTALEAATDAPVDAGTADAGAADDVVAPGDAGGDAADGAR